MATQTITITGKAYNAEGSDVSATLTVNGAQQHNGVVPTVASAAPALGSYTDALDAVLVSYTKDTSDTEETLSMTMVVSGGDIIVVGVNTTHGLTLDEAPLVKETEQVKTNVTIDNVAVTAPVDPGENHWLVKDGETITFDVSVPGYTGL